MVDYDDKDNKDKKVTVGNTLLLNDNPWVEYMEYCFLRYVQITCHF